MDTTLAVTPSVRGRGGAEEYGVEVSPVAKRPMRLQLPANATALVDGQAMTVEQLTVAIRNLDSREQAKLQWYQQVEDAVIDHADQLEACARDAIGHRARMGEYADHVNVFKTTLESVLKGAETQIASLFGRTDDLFQKTDQVLVQLEAADAALKASLEARVGQVEDAVRGLSATKAAGAEYDAAPWAPAWSAG